MNGLNTLELIIEEAKTLSPIPLAAVREYDEKKEILALEVSRELMTYPSLSDLINQNPPEMLFDHQRHHAHFMVNILRLNRVDLFIQTILWEYRAYSAHGFSYEYFPLALKTWIPILEKYLTPPSAQAIKKIYEWLINQHTHLMTLSKVELNPAITLDLTWQTVQESFFSALLLGEHRNCLRIALESIHIPTDLEQFYLKVLQPCLYEIGTLWERGKISNTQGQLASAIVARIMSVFSSRFLLVKHTKGKAVVTSAPGEFHELGVRMIADLLELKGWDVQYLGINPSQRDLISLLQTSKPHLLVLSITMLFNVESARKIIEVIKNDPDLRKIKIMVGGLTFNQVPDLYRVIGADGWAPNCKAAVDLAQEWWQEIETESSMENSSSF
jgi:methanogenic corrinoid protein MtbC1